MEALRWITEGLDDLRSRPSEQLSFLDGLRSMAVLLVIAAHVANFFSEHYGTNVLSRRLENGWIGVDLFFVLSGYLIGKQLWKEFTKTGSISLKQFILRRGLRIWPLYFVVFLAILLLFPEAARVKQFGWSDLIFLTNYFNRGIVLGGWSLSTEEQFYLVAPLGILVASRFYRRLAQIRPWLWLTFFATPVLRTLVYTHRVSLMSHSPAGFSAVYYQGHLHCDGLILGLILANYAVANDYPKWKWLTTLLLPLTGFTIFAVEHFAHKELLDFQGLAILFGSLLWYGIYSRSRILNAKLFYWISRLSFGMYLLHPYLVDPIAGRFGTNIAAEIVATMAVAAASASLSFVTFTLVEKPFLRLRDLLLAGSPTHTNEKAIKLAAAAAS